MIESRKSIEAGIRDADSVVRANRVQSNYFDLGQILDYWGPKRLNHHTEGTTMLYGARECARVLLEEGWLTAFRGTACTVTRCSPEFRASA